MRQFFDFNPIKIQNQRKNMSNIRFDALKMAWEHKPVMVEAPTEKASVIFAQKVFTREKMKKDYEKEIFCVL